MKTAEGTQLVLSPTTAYALRNILTEWVNERTPVHKYVEGRYGHLSEGFRELKEKSLTERMVRMHMVLEQLKED
jgi:hypothetical protein